MKYPSVAIVILNFNGIEDTRHCLRSLLKTDYPNFRVIVADNGSINNEALILSKSINDTRVSFIRFKKNYGFTGGNNKVLRSLKEKYIVLLNNDTMVPQSWLTPLVIQMEKDNRIAVIQPKILWAKDKKYFDYAGACGGFIDMFGYPFTRGRIFNSLEPDRGQYNWRCKVLWASGAAMLIRRRVIDIVGLFDESFFNYMEEIDLCIRIYKVRYKVLCEPSSYIYHKVASTAGRRSDLKRFWEHRNNLLLLLKHYPLLTLLYIFPLRLCMDYMSILYYLSTGKPLYVLAVIKSQIALMGMIPQIIRYRKNNSAIKFSDIPKVVYPGSIVFAYFILKLHVFSQIFDNKYKLKKITF